jgi:hypothetical protein
MASEERRYPTRTRSAPSRLVMEPLIVLNDGTVCERERYEETQNELVDSPRSQPDLLMDWLLDASDDESDYEPPKQDPGDLPVPQGLDEDDELKAELADLMDETAATGSDDEDVLASSTEEGQDTDEDESGSCSPQQQGARPTSERLREPYEYLPCEYLVDTYFDEDLLK